MESEGGTARRQEKSETERVGAALPREGDGGSDGGSDRDSDKDSDRDSDKDLDGDPDKDLHKYSDRCSKDSDRDPDKDSDRDSDRDSDKDSDKYSDRGSDDDYWPSPRPAGAYTKAAEINQKYQVRLGYGLGSRLAIGSDRLVQRL